MEPLQADQFKEVKQRLSVQQASIAKILKDGKLPLPEDVAAFVNTSQEMARLGDPKWSAAMARYTDQLVHLEQAMVADNPEDIRQAFNVLNDHKLNCHKEFRADH